MDGAFQPFDDDLRTALRWLGHAADAGDAASARRALIRAFKLTLVLHVLGERALTPLLLETVFADRGRGDGQVPPSHPPAASA